MSFFITKDERVWPGTNLPLQRDTVRFVNDAVHEMKYWAATAPNDVHYAKSCERAEQVFDGINWTTYQR